MQKINEGCKSNPDETCVCDNDKRTALHLIFYSRGLNEEKISAIQSILHSNPHATLLRDKLGNTPLHIASYHPNNYDLISLICNAAIQIEGLLTCNDTHTERNLCCKCFYCGICYYLGKSKDKDGYSCTFYNNNEIHNTKISARHDIREYRYSYDTIAELRSPFFLSCENHTTPLEVIEVLLNMSTNHKNQLKINYNDFLLHSLMQPCSGECIHGTFFRNYL